MHLQAAEAFSTALISKFGTFSGSWRYFPKLTISDSSALSTLKAISYSRSLLLLSNFIEAAHQSTSILSVSGFLTFSVGFGYMIKQRAFITTLIIFGGFFMVFSKSICFFSSTFKAFSASLRAGIASDSSA